jgi:tetratricopeptide (TPR) repeat protein
MKKILVLTLALAAGWTALAEPFVPKDGSQPLERLRATPLDPAHRQLRELRAELSQNPRNPISAAAFARFCIDKARSESDPRYLGRAQAALDPWWNEANPPVEILVLRATVKQSQHEFRDALADLDAAVRRDPRNAQAWLIRATVLTVLGDYASARRACVPLAQLAPGLIAVTAAANVACLDGGAEGACALVRGALDGNPRASAPEKMWAVTLLAETYQRIGKNAQAEACFKNALNLNLPDPYLTGAYADFLIDSGRCAEAADLLKNDTRADGLLLRLAEAESKMNPQPASFKTHEADLATRFEAGHLRGDFVHQREEARFALRVLHRPDDALRLAEANWQIQREPADARLFVEAARAAANPAMARPALDFVRTNHLEDTHIQ